jgi:hypothetical protein
LKSNNDGALAINNNENFLSDIKMKGIMGIKKLGIKNNDNYNVNSYIWPVKQKKLNDAFADTIDFDNIIPEEI